MRWVTTKMISWSNHRKSIYSRCMQLIYFMNRWNLIRTQVRHRRRTNRRFVHLFAHWSRAVLNILNWHDAKSEITIANSTHTHAYIHACREHRAHTHTRVSMMQYQKKWCKMKISNINRGNEKLCERKERTWKSECLFWFNFRSLNRIQTFRKCCWRVCRLTIAFDNIWYSKTAYTLGYACVPFLPICDFQRRKRLNRHIYTHTLAHTLMLVYVQHVGLILRFIYIRNSNCIALQQTRRERISCPPTKFKTKNFSFSLPCTAKNISVSEDRITGQYRNRSNKIWDPHPQYLIDAFGLHLHLVLFQSNAFMPKVNA